jgi:hypothetical protein
MDPLVPARRDEWLDRPGTVGTPRHWARNGSLLGGLLGWWVPAAIVAGLVLVTGDGLFVLVMGFLNPLNLASALAGGLVGGLLGMVHPALLDRVRGRVPVLAIAAAQAVTGAIAGAAAGAAWSLPFAMIEGASTLFLITSLIGGMLGALVAPIWWLPFAVSTVLGRQWPVTMTVAVGFPVLLVPICAGLGSLL